MKITRDSIFYLIKSSGGRGITVKEMVVALSQKKKRKTQIRKILRLLSKQNACFKKNNRYFPVDPSQEIKGPTGKSKNRSKSQNLKRKQNLGLILGDRKQRLYSFSGKERFILSNGGLRDVFHGDVVSFDIIRQKNGQKAAVVNQLIERRIKLLKGKVYKKNKGQLIFSPDSKVLNRDFNVSNRVALKNEQGEPAWFELNSYSSKKQTLGGEVRLISDREDWVKKSISEILATNDIPERFPRSILEESKKFSKRISLDKKSKRRDLRHLPFVTIDGDDAKDFDDAIYAAEEGDNYRLWISIADVADYVKPGTALDREAFCRGTSTYIPGTAYPMLPDSLSTDLCSLKEGVNRKTITIEILIEKSGKVIHSEVYESIHKIARRLTYSIVDEFYESGKIRVTKSFPDVKKHLHLYREITLKMQSIRERNGMINFSLPESEYIFDRFNRLKEIRKRFQTIARQMIEQFMLLANEQVAKFCEKRQIPIVWRNHPKPLPDKQKQLMRLFWNNNIELKSLRTSKDYNLALKKVQKSKEKESLEYSMLRSMAIAVYEAERKGHFGLASTHYCHFTSPIRRYPDLIVHQALKRYFKGIKTRKIQNSVAATASERERLATMAERQSEKVIKLDFVSNRIGDIFEARVNGFVNSGFFVEIENPFVEGYLSFSTIYDDHYELNIEGQFVQGQRERKKVRIGQKLQVFLSGLDWRNLSPEFDWICWKE